MLHVVEKKGDVWTVCDMKFEPDAIVFDWSTSPRLCPACYYGLFPVVPSRAESPPPPARGEDD
jgi:hypothetical protein